MQITFDVGYSRWVADVTGAELEAMTALFSKAVKCHSPWSEEEERTKGVLQVERAERLDLSVKLNAQPLTLCDWVEPPKPDPKPAAPAALKNIAKAIETPDIRDFMDEQLASPEQPAGAPDER